MGPNRKFFCWIFLATMTTFSNFCVIFWYLPVDSQKCADFENTKFFYFSIILSWFNWPRSKNGTNFWPNRAIFLVFATSKLPLLFTFQQSFLHQQKALTDTSFYDTLIGMNRTLMEKSNFLNTSVASIGASAPFWRSQT